MKNVPTDDLKARSAAYDRSISEREAELSQWKAEKAAIEDEVKSRDGKAPK